MGSQSEMLGWNVGRKFNSDTLHQDLICYAAKNKYIRLIKTWFSFINFCLLETNPKTTSFHMYIVYQRNKLFMGKYLFLYLYFIFNIWGREKISMIERGQRMKKV